MKDLGNDQGLSQQAPGSGQTSGATSGNNSGQDPSYIPDSNQSSRDHSQPPLLRNRQVSRSVARSEDVLWGQLEEIRAKMSSCQVQIQHLEKETEKDESQNVTQILSLMAEVSLGQLREREILDKLENLKSN